MRNEIIFENGIKHAFTDDEFRMLCIAVNELNSGSLPWLVSGDDRRKELLQAIADLKALFDNVDY